MPIPYQPRRQFNPAPEIASLADSLRQHGMLQPVLVPRGRRTLPAHRRRTAATGQHRGPAARDCRRGSSCLDDQRVFELAMVENLQREDLNAVDKATAFREYLARYGGTQEELAGRLGLDRSTVLQPDPSCSSSPMRSWTPFDQARSPRGTPEPCSAYPTPTAAMDACRRIVTEHLSVRQTEALVATGIPTPARPRVRRDQAHDPEPKLPHLVELEQHLTSGFGTPVLIRARTPERGQIVIDYNSQEDFDRVTSLIR